MSFTDAVRVCFRKYFQFSGRASRPEFWWFSLFLVLVTTVLSFVDEALLGFDGLWTPLASIFGVVTFIPSMSVGFRRMHDTGRAGWVLVVPTLIAGIAAAAAIYIVFSLLTGSLDEAQVAIFSTWLGIVLPLAVLLLLVVMGLMIWWLARPAEPGPNRYGPQPDA